MSIIKELRFIKKINSLQKQKDKSKIEKQEKIRESIIEKQISKYAKNKGWLSEKLTSGGGIPDRLFLKNRYAVMIEFKSTINTLTEVQEKYKKMIVDGNFAEYYIVNSIEKGKEVFDNLEKRGY